MSGHPNVKRMLDAGFELLPTLNEQGLDTMLQFYKWGPKRVYLDVAVVFHDGYAVASRMPPVRDWRQPFENTGTVLVPPTTFEAMAVELETRFRDPNVQGRSVGRA